MRNRKYSMLTRLRSAAILLALSCSHLATRPAGMGAKKVYAAMTAVPARVREPVNRPKTKKPYTEIGRPLLRTAYFHHLY